jgi:hypothetical protein
MAAPPVAKYTQADFDKENAVFRTVYQGRELTYPICDGYFSWGMYDASDKTVVQCHACRNHRLAAARGISMRDSHIAIMVLNKLLLDSKNPVERNVAQVYQRVLALAPTPSEKFDDESRADRRRRAINVSCNFFKKPVMLFAKYLVDTKQAADTKDAVQKLAQNEACGNFVDAIACEMCRMSTARTNQ